METIYQALAPYAGYLALSILGLFILAILYRVVRFLMGPAPVVVPEFTQEHIVMPPAILMDKAARDRFNDLDCKTDWDVMMEAKNLHRTHVERAQKAKWN